MSVRSFQQIVNDRKVARDPVRHAAPFFVIGLGAGYAVMDRAGRVATYQEAANPVPVVRQWARAAEAQDFIDRHAKGNEMPGLDCRCNYVRFLNLDEAETWMPAPGL